MNRLQLSFLGPFQVSLDGRTVTGFESNKVRALLAYLAVESQRPHSREGLCGLLWPDWPQASALSSLRNALADLRKNLNDSAANPPFLLVSRESLQFNPESDAWLDVAEFEKTITNLRVASRDDPQSTISNLKSAIALSRGPFLEGFTLPENNPFEEWLTVERERYQQEMVGALRCLADLFERQGELEQALASARQGLALEPWLEEEHQRVMRLLALSGQRSEALAQYVSCATLLTRELGVAPGDETRRLYEAIRDGTLEKWTGPAFRGVKEPPAPGPSPYKGLQFFDEADAGLFFGREALVTQLLERLIPGDPLARRRPFDRFLAVIGASGSGKSSVVRAGLVPAVRRLVSWPVFVLTPTAHPLEALAACLTQGSESVTATATLIDDLAADPRSLHLFARKLVGAQGDDVLLIVDQFEELFSLCRDEGERVAFIDNLLTAVCAEGPIHLLVALRADFYAACAPYENLRQALGQRQAFIGPMAAAELRQAIEEPARLGKWDLEAGLVELFLRDLGAGGDGQAAEPGALPLLSHALLETWLRRQGRTLTLEGYAEAGGVKGSIARTAENIYGQLTAEEQSIARGVFLRLTELGEGAQETRRRAGLAELAAGGDGQARRVLKTLADARLVVISGETAEVAHEAVIREWSRLQDWLNEDREGLRLHRRLTEAALEWESLGREASLLYRGTRLAQALEWGQRHDSLLNDLERGFLQASKSESERDAAEREAQRRRELEAAQKLLEEQALYTRSLHRRNIYLRVALAIAFVLALAAGMFARQALNNARLSNARELAAAAINNLEVDQERSLLLAIQAVKTADLSETETALHRAIGAARLRDTMPGTKEKYIGVAFAPDEGHFATIDQEGIIRIWKIEVPSLKINRTPQRILKNIIGHRYYGNPVRPIAFSPDGKLLAAVSEKDTAKVWDVATGTLKFTLTTGDQQEFLLVTFSPDSSLLATARSDNRIHIWDTRFGQELQTLNTHHFISGDSLSGVEFGPDGNQLIATSYRGFISLWKRNKIGDKGYGFYPYSFVTNIRENFSLFGAIAFSRDGKQLAIGDCTFIKIYDVNSDKDIDPLTLSKSTYGQENCLNNLYFTSTNTRLIGGGDESTVKVWDAVTGQKLFSLAANTGLISNMAISQSTDRLVTINNDSSVNVWDLSLEGNQEWPTIPQVDRNNILSNDGKQLLSLSENEPHGIAVWEYSSEGLRQKKFLNLGEICQEPEKCIFDADPDFSYFVAVRGDEDQTVTLWNINTKQILSSFRLSQSFIDNITLSPNGQRLVTFRTSDGTLIIWNLETKKPLLFFKNIDLNLINGAFSPNNALFVTGGFDGTMRLWDVNNGKLVRELEEHDKEIWARFSPDGMQLLSFSSDGTAKVLDAQTGKVIHSLTVIDNSGISDMAASPDGKYLATAYYDGIGTLWDATTGKALFNLFGSIVGFTPDSKHLISQNLKWLHKTALVNGYILDIGDAMEVARSRLTRTWTLEECRQFLHTDTCPPAP